MLSGTGARIGEVLGCQWRDLSVHTKSPKWSIQRTAYKRDNGEWLINKPNSRKARRLIDLPQSLVLVLSRLREQREADAEYFGWTLDENDFIFIRPDSTLPDPHHVSRVFKEIAIKAGLNPIRLHDLRHTHATLLLLAGIHPKIVSERLGHASIQITLDTYSHVAPGLQQAAAKRFDDIVHGFYENETKEILR